MGYKIQQFRPLLGSASSPVTLSGSYSDAAPANSAKANVKGKERVTLKVFYTMGAAETGNTLQIKYGWADSDLAIDSALWARDVTGSISSGTRTISLAEDTFSATQTAGTYDVFRIPIEVNDAYLKVSVKETGIAANGGSCYIQIAEGGV